jgi:hypothetical protein
MATNDNTPPFQQKQQQPLTVDDLLSWSSSYIVFILHYIISYQSFLCLYQYLQ